MGLDLKKALKQQPCWPRTRLGYSGLFDMTKTNAVLEQQKYLHSSGEVLAPGLLWCIQQRLQRQKVCCLTVNISLKERQSFTLTQEGEAPMKFTSVKEFQKCGDALRNPTWMHKNTHNSGVHACRQAERGCGAGEQADWRASRQAGKHTHENSEACALLACKRACLQA